MKQGNDIYSAEHFVSACNEDEGLVDYVHIPLYDSFRSRSWLPFLVSPNEVKGSMKVHSVAVTAPGERIAVRATSCFEECCWDSAGLSPKLGGICQSTGVKAEWVEFELFDYDIMLELDELESLKCDQLEEARKQAEKEAAAKAAKVAKAAALKQANQTAGSTSSTPSAAAMQVDQAASAAMEVDQAAQSQPGAEQPQQGGQSDPPARVSGQQAQEPAAQAAAVDHPIRQEVFQRGAYVAAIWGGEWYVAQVDSDRLATGTYNLNFMRPAFRSTSRNSSLSWPRLTDQYEIVEGDILCVLADPVKFQRARSTLTKITEEEFDSVQALFHVHLHCQSELRKDGRRRGRRR